MMVRKENRLSCQHVFLTLLVNGTSGIAVGMATNIPPHQLGEVIDGVLAISRDPEITIQELMDIIPGPDFPTGGYDSWPKWDS